MKLTESRSDETGENVYEVRISDADLIIVRLTKADHLVIDNLDSDLVSDRILLLYTIARAMEVGGEE